MLLSVVTSTWIWCMYKLDLRTNLLWEVGTNIWLNGDMQKEQALTLGVLSTFRYSASWLF